MSLEKILCGAAGLGILSVLSACSDNLAAQQNKLDQFVARHQVGSSNDFWLELFNVAGEWERVALVTGYFDDYSGCMDIARSLTNEFGRQYRCSPAN